MPDKTDLKRIGKVEDRADSAGNTLGACLPAERSRAARLREVWQDHVSERRALISVVAVLILWELTARFVVDNRLFLVPISEIFQALMKLAASGELQHHTAVSFAAFGIGFGIATVIGIGFGLLMGVSTTLRDYMDPWVSALYTTPTVVFAPIFIMWFGLGISSKVAVIFLMVVFPVLINTYAGVVSTSLVFLEVGRSFGATRLQIFQKILLPSALPFVFAGLRQGVSRGLVGIVVAELFGARAGLGYLLFLSLQNFAMEMMFVSVVVLAGSGVLAVELLKRLEALLAPWHHFEYKD